MALSTRHPSGTGQNARTYEHEDLSVLERTLVLFLLLAGQAG